MLYRRLQSPSGITERVHAILAVAFGIAEQIGDREVSPEHIALGLIRVGGGVATSALQFQGVQLDKLDGELEAHLRPRAGEKRSRGDVVLSFASQRLIAQSRAEADALKHNYIGTEHLLLALLSDDHGVAS